MENMLVFQLPLGLVFLFMLGLAVVVLQRPEMFFKKHGKYHAFIGLLYLVWIGYGFVRIAQEKEGSQSFQFVYDVVLGILGTLLPIFAAHEFQHKNVVNVASGTLDEHTLVTYSEMVEHTFYQVLNLFQIVFLHAMVWIAGLYHTYSGRVNDWHSPYSYLHILALIFVTSLWNVRHFFPVNKFSDNYLKIDEQSTDFVRLLYRIKKYQYVFYKHFLLNGLNLTIVYNFHQLLFPRVGSLVGGQFIEQQSLLNLVHQREFHIYWLCLNFSYVMEFFLQTLVKKGDLSQSTMLLFQQVLMVAATVVAVNVLSYVLLPLAVLSLLFNFIHRKHDFLNTLIIFVGWTVVNTLSFPAK